MIAVKSFLRRMIELPLFQGMSQTDLEDVAGHTKLGFLRVASRKPIVQEGDACTNVFLLMTGEANVVSYADDGSYSITESLKAPAVFQLECLFGFTQRHTRSFIARSHCQLITMSKMEVLSLCERNEIFRLNLLNNLSTYSQRCARHPWRQKPSTIRQKLFRFLEDRTLRPAGQVTLRMKMTALAQYIGESRLNVSKELNAMQEEGLLRFSRGIIHITAIEKLR